MLFTPVIWMDGWMDNREIITELSNKLEDTFTRKEVTKVVVYRPNKVLYNRLFEE